ncbi:TlpA disulfide reductase family protein [Mucilaginibacter terrae]|uniref:Peroxiredoxin n=1 Tax=Mucilaginibacter terrae TaxID=1955052 RepID=A0ABU3GTT0_9SPHI|nr:TlpA disulfide reductase family protein [Mucilaginibacter terrae]MDT3403164.1 peroxiredoxin [Mucilaginibacter terrae]
MKKCLTLLSLLLPLLTYAQKPFTVTGTGGGFKKGDKLYLSYIVDGKHILDSVIVSGSTFKFKGITTGIWRTNIYKNEDPRVIDISHDAVTFYIEPGDILITSRDSMERAKISGTANNVDHTELRDALWPIRKKYAKAVSAYDNLSEEQQKDLENVAAIRQVYKQRDQELLPVQLAFINKKPNSYISLIALQEISYNKDFVKETTIAYNSINSELKESTIGKKVQQNINASLKAISGIMAPDFNLPDVAGKSVSLADYKGKYTLIDFWASWCLPCRAENPFVKSAYEKYKDKGFTVLGVSLDKPETQAAWLKAIKDDGLPWTHVSDMKGFNSKVAHLYGITSIPANVLVNPEGKIIATNLKDQTLHNKLAEIFSVTATN